MSRAPPALAAPANSTFSHLLQLCARGGRAALDAGRAAHARMLVSGFVPTAFVSNCLLQMYARCADAACARRVFDAMPHRDTVSWNTLLTAYSHSGDITTAVSLFDAMPNQDVVSWNTLVSSYCQHGMYSESVALFLKMTRSGVASDRTTFAVLLKSCGALDDFALGVQIHALAVKAGLDIDVRTGSALVDMYGKCGYMQDSLLMFEKAQKRDFVSWNAMICGYALHGQGAEALKMFDRMQREDVVPNHATFVAVLRACSHVGQLDDGCCYFHQMTTHYKLEPQLEHFACMVDILGRSKGPQEALNFIGTMPFEADAVIWKTLLSVCKIHRDVEVAELAAGNVLLLDPEDSSVYILLSNVYAESGKWADVSRTRRLMKQGRLKKEPGCSWIEVQNEMHGFLVGDNVHPRSRELYDMLHDLLDEMKLSGYDPDSASFAEVDEEGSASEQDDLLGMVGG
uniref:Pentatricopeptide repeat-containing protein n=1 Tax=Aegilops tauschii subsp. strangulata TaxID=200361 RepID=A0A452YSK2_AEGTS